MTVVAEVGIWGTNQHLRKGLKEGTVTEGIDNREILPCCPGRGRERVGAQVEKDKGLVSVQKMRPATGASWQR